MWSCGLSKIKLWFSEVINCSTNCYPGFDDGEDMILGDSEMSGDYRFVAFSELSL